MRVGSAISDQTVSGGAAMWVLTSSSGTTGKRNAILGAVARRIGPDEWQREPGQNADMERAVAVSGRTVGSVGLSSSVVTTQAGGTSRVHHHGECETSIYVMSGLARFTWGRTGVEEAFEATAGDIVYIPAGELHVEENASTTDPLVVLVTRNCPEAVTIYAAP
jgi:uncharacterized RmlC-like cupin family protein